MFKPFVYISISKHSNKLFLFQFETKINVVIHKKSIQNKADSELTVFHIVPLVVNDIDNISV